MHTIVRMWFIYFFLIIYGGVSHAQVMPQGQLKPQDIDAILNSMTEDDFNTILNELSKLSPQELEELEKIGRQVLIESGIDPDTGKPLEGGNQPALQQSRSTSPVEINRSQDDTQAAVVIHSANNVAHIIANIINQINALRQKSLTNDLIHRRIMQWEESLYDILFYLKIINKKNHHERLATKDFEQLFNDLQELERALEIYQPHIAIVKGTPKEDDPYVILRVPYTAAAEEITEKYKELKKKYHPKNVKKRLEKSQASKKDSDREIRAASLTLSLIQDAYDQLNDANTKNIIDKKRLSEEHNKLSQAAQRALEQTLQALSNAIYQKKIIDELQDFLKKFEPEELKKKESWEKDQAQRHKEQLEQIKMKPSLNQTRYDKSYGQRSPNPNYDALGASRNYNPEAAFYPNQYQQPAAPNKEPLKTLAQEGKQEPTNKKPESSTAPVKKDEPDEKTKKLMDDTAKKDAAKKKETDEKKVKDLEEKIKRYESADTKADVASAKKGESLQEKKLKDESGEPESTLIMLKTLENNFASLKKSVSSKKISRIIRRTNRATSPLIDQSELEALSTLLNLDTIETNLLAFKNELNNNNKDDYQQRWIKLEQSSTKSLSTLAQLINSEQEKIKRQGKTTPDILIALNNNLLGAINTYNTITEKILNRKALNQINNKADISGNDSEEKAKQETLLGDLL